MAEEGEAGFQVGVAVGVVRADAVTGEVDLGGGVEGGGEGIGPGVATGGVGASAAGGEPAVATAGGVAVDGDEEDVVFAQLAAPLVHAAATLGQVLAQFINIHPRRESAIGGVILRQGAQFPDFLEQCGNRLGQVVECNGFFYFVHCLQGLSETMASHFVATEKETRSPLWKSGRKVGIIK